MSVTVKASLNNYDESNPEIRRFTMEGDSSTKFSNLVDKIKQTFPSLADKNLSLYWKGKFLLSLYLLLAIQLHAFLV